MMQPEDLKQWFDTMQNWLETAYLSHEEPWRQSGMSGPEERWISLRKPIADCMDISGDFLDIGCIVIQPYGLDISRNMVYLARGRLPQVTDHFFVGNALEWIPPLRFDYVHTELVYVPAEYEKPYVGHLLKSYLKPGGRLLVTNYTEDHPSPEKGIMPGSHPTKRIVERLSELGF